MKIKLKAVDWPIHGAGSDPYVFELDGKGYTVENSSDAYYFIRRLSHALRRQQDADAQKDDHEFPGLEVLARQLVDKHLANELPPDVGYILFLMHHGRDAGGFAHVSSVERSGAAALMVEWLDRVVLKADGAFQRKVRDAITKALEVDKGV